MKITFMSKIYRISESKICPLAEGTGKVIRYFPLPFLTNIYQYLFKWVFFDFISIVFIIFPV